VGSGHFHFYRLLGVLPMALALMFHVLGRSAGAPPNTGSDRLGPPAFAIGGLIFVLSFLDAGRLSVARRMDAHLPAWIRTDKFGSIGALLVVLGMLYFSVRITAGLLKTSVHEGSGNGTANAAR